MKTTNHTGRYCPSSALLALVESELAGVIALYEQLVEQSDKLANAMQYRADYVLGKVMPKKVGERRDAGRIGVWFDECREDMLAHVEEIEAARVKLDEREKLLESLNLTDAQKSLLFEG
jgi:hypothetical protein